MHKDNDRRDIDWVSIEREYRAGIRTVRDIAEQYEVTPGAIGNRAKRNDWARDLNVKINQKREELVNKARVNKTVNKERLITENLLVKNSAEIQKVAILQESDEIKQLSEARDRLIQDLIAVPTDGEGQPISLEIQTRILKSLAEITEKIANLRRRNLNIKDTAEETKSTTISDLEKEARALGYLA